jgi:hypothetical protein
MAKYLRRTFSLHPSQVDWFPAQVPLCGGGHLFAYQDPEQP